MKPFLIKLNRWSAGVLLAILTPCLSAQLESPPVGVAVKIYARGAGGSGSVSLSGTFLESSPGAGDAYASASANVSNGYATAILGSQGIVRLEPNKSYTVAVGGATTTGRELNVVAPPGYRVNMDNIIRTRESYSGTANIIVQIQSLGARHPGLAGMASTVASSEVEWRLSLGSLRNGSSAGDLTIVDTGTRSDWAPIFTPSMLHYETTSDEVSVYRPSNVIRQIVANQVVVDVVTINSTKYEIRCYYPAQMQGGSFTYTFTGSAYATYIVEQGATTKTLKITKEIRNVTDTSTTFPVARREIMTLARTGSWPAFAWTRQEWTLDGQTPLAETFVQGGGTTANRTEAIVMRVPGPGATTPAFSVTRNYAALTSLGEALASETVGTNTGLTSTFTYHNDTTHFGIFAQLKSAILPGGNWVAYDYYDADLAAGFRGGRVKYRYKPYLDIPGTVSMSQGQGEVTYYEYVNDVFGAPVRPSLAETRINGTLTAKTTTSYNDSYATVNGYGTTQATRSEYSSLAQNLQTIVRAYRDDVTEAFVRGQLYSVTGPDGVKQSYVYQRGTWNGTAFSVGSGALGSGTASRVSVISGSSNAASGTAYTSQDSYTVDTVYLVDGKSTMDVTIRDSRALVVRAESHARKSGAWQLISSTTYAYDYAGRLTSRVGSNGATYTASYDGGLKTSETDEAGVVTNFAYDAAGRLSVKTRQGLGVIGSLATRYTYDAAGRVTEEHVGWGLAERILAASQFDDAGRILVETPPAGYGTLTHSYNPSARTDTVTRADGATVVTARYLDGSALSATGTGVVPTYRSYGVDGDGRRWTQVNLGTSNSARWNKSWTDWLGREVKTEAPGFTSQPNTVTESFYDQLFSPVAVSAGGHLLKSTKTGYAATFYEYDYLGQVSRSGLDYDGSGRLEIASSDRITDTETSLESYGGSWWVRTDTKTYPKPGSAAVITTSTTRSRLTGFGTNRLTESMTIDAEGNVTTRYMTANRSSRIATLTTTRSGITGSRVESSTNGLPTGVTDFDGLMTATEYDALLRPRVAEDSRGNRTTTAYAFSTRLVQTVTNAAGNQSVTAYDGNGRVSWTRDPKNYYTRYQYNARGQVLRQWGDGTMPVEYGYDSTYGDKTSLSTFRGGTGWDGSSWPGSPGTADTTTFAYHEATGLLTTKTDAASRAVTQTYNQRGQTATRTLARGVVTTYGYDSATGELLTQTYSDSTPAVTYTYGRSGQVETVADYTGTRDMVYDPVKPWRLTAEVQDAFYGARAVTRLYDESGIIGRVRGFQVGTAVGSTSDLEETFGFTSAGRFETLSTRRETNATARTFRYAYLPNSGLLQSLSIDGSHPFTVTRTYETQRNVLTALDTKWTTTSQTKYTYTTDERGQRATAVQTGSVFADFGGADSGATFRLYTYNGRGELTGDIGYLGSTTSDQTKPLNGRRHEFAYDTAGNRQSSNRTGVSDLRDDYTTNALNQYVTRENNTVPVSGTAEPESSPSGGAGGTAVAIEGRDAPAGRQGRYWNDDVVVNNNSPSAHPWRGPLTIYTAKRGTGGGADIFRMDVRMAQIAAILQDFTYDYDGNLTSDGLMDYAWDAENRLVRMETTSVAQGYNFPHWLIEFRYDYMGRRVQKRVLDAGPTPAVEISCRRYLYDGWSLIAEYNATGGTLGSLVRSYTWGLDIAVSLSDAGGVGALLQIADHPSGKTYLPTYDGNGNIVSLLNADSGAVAAAYEYSAFGEPLRAQTFDPLIADNPFRFSSKYTDLETGLVYYGHRYYDPRNGRFINRDPIEEAGGFNLYGFCGNDGVNRWDVLGHHPEDGGVDWSTVERMPTVMPATSTSADVLLNSYITGPLIHYVFSDGRGGSYETSEAYGNNTDDNAHSFTSPQTGYSLVVDGVNQGTIDQSEVGVYMESSYRADHPNIEVKLPSSVGIAATAALAAYAMGDTVPDGYSVAQKFTIKKDGTDAILFNNNTTGELVLAYRGTVTLADLATDVYNALGGKSERYEAAINIAKDVKLQNMGVNITLVGHSLGGGQAALASAATKLTAITFDAAGVNPRKYNIPMPSGDNITNYSIVGEPLTTFQLLTPFPNALGTQIYLPAATLPAPWNALNHGAQEMLSAVGASRPVPID